MAEAGAQAGATSPDSTRSIEPPSINKLTFVTIVSLENGAIFANLILVVPGPARTVGTTFRATFSSAARSCTRRCSLWVRSHSCGLHCFTALRFATARASGQYLASTRKFPILGAFSPRQRETNALLGSRDASAPADGDKFVYQRPLL